MTRSRELGFTLTELMVVVAIIAVLAAIFAPSPGSSTDVPATSRQIAGAIGEAARIAVARGSLDPSVVASEGSSERTRVSISQTPPHAMLVEVRREVSATTSVWETVSQATLPRDFRIVGDDTAARISPGNIPVALTGIVQIDCAANGRCRATTLYVARGSASSPRSPYRVVVMPLAASPQVLKGW